MRVAILGDVHANLEALDVVISAARDAGVERWLQVGDVIGYGPDPNACFERLRDVEALICLGNHDAALTGALSLDYFNPFARAALEWTAGVLSEENLRQLEELPIRRELTDFGSTLVHGSLFRPETFDYVRSEVSAARSMEHQSSTLCFVGHTHLPCLFRITPEQGCQLVPGFERGERILYGGMGRVLVNVGSVGQPRDEDSRTGFVLLDTSEESLRLFRFDYPVDKVQERIRAAGLPSVLADRLGYGL